MQNERPDPAEPQPSFSKKGGGWVLAQFFVMAAWFVLTPVRHGVTSSRWLWIPAILLIVTGAAAGIAGTFVLGRNRTPFPKPRSGSRLIQTGIYALVRHPLYASLIALGLGWACLWGSGLGAALAVAQALFLDAKARREDMWFEQQFPEYAAYAAKVRRLIPWVY